MCNLFAHIYIHFIYTILYFSIKSYFIICLFHPLFWRHTDTAAFSSGLTGRSEVTLVDTGLILSPLWDQHSIHVEWEREHPGLPASSPTHLQRLTLCVTFPHVAAYMYATHPPFHSHVFVDVLFLQISHISEMTVMFMRCSKLLWVCVCVWGEFFLIISRRCHVGSHLRHYVQ